ncbi:MAG: 2-C-methyl-D-erythritol 4-phosphate cytidylyltransferase [Candidatus Omnitrophota bacterium]
MKVAAIVPAAGKGKRIRSSIPKPYIRIKDKPILIHTLSRLSRSKSISEVIVACDKENMALAERLIKRFSIKKTKVVEGGKERKDSVLNALKSVSKDVDYILVHDAVRPNISNEIIDSSIKAAKKYKASCVAVPVKPTLKYVEKDLISYTPIRKRFWEAQTPQVVRKDLLEKAYKKIRPKSVITDDCMLVESIGVRPKVVMGSYSNIKITTKEDLEIAKVLMNRRLR